MTSELPDHQAMFTRFLYDSKDEAGARTRFQRLVTDLVTVKLPAASEVAYPGGGDWGIDTYVGDLDGDIVVWQSKFFTAWSETQQGEIRSSFKQLRDKAAENGFTVTVWTLCVPSILPPDQQKWFDGWRKRTTKETGVRIELWNGATIRGALQQADARHLRELYFPEQASASEDVPVAKLTNPATLADSLFVVQLESAGRVETDAAKGFYFTAEAMARDVAGRGLPSEIGALNEAQLEVHGVWEEAYNAGLGQASEDGRIVGLVEDVNQKVGLLPSSSALRLRPAHRRGLMHRLVEAARAGWVSQWRDIADAYRGTPAPVALERSGELIAPTQALPVGEEVDDARFRAGN